MNFKELEEKVIQWGKDRYLYHPEHGANATSQLQKFFEEFGELNQALLKNDREAIKDAIGDCQVCLISRAKFLGQEINIELEVGVKKHLEELQQYYNENKQEALEEFLEETCDSAFNNIEDAIISLECFSFIFGFEHLECLNQAYNEIKDRKGSMINGQFVKE